MILLSTFHVSALQPEQSQSMNCKHLFVVAIDLVNCIFEYRESWG